MQKTWKNDSTTDALSSPLITISVVSHNQGKLIEPLMLNFQKYCSNLIEVILTINVPERLSFNSDNFAFPIHIIENPKPKGFGANHNAAFHRENGHFFCVLNPDIRLTCNPFPFLIKCFNDKRVGVAAPLIVNQNGEIEDNARKFPTPRSIISKALGNVKPLDYPIGSDPIYPDWIAGMFLLFQRHCFKEIGGFNEKYFLYYEDVDLCARMKLAGYTPILCPSVSVIHNARRESHRNLKYFKWHLMSIARFFLSPVFFRSVIRNRIKGSAYDEETSVRQD